MDHFDQVLLKTLGGQTKMFSSFPWDMVMIRFFRTCLYLAFHFFFCVKQLLLYQIIKSKCKTSFRKSSVSRKNTKIFDIQEECQVQRQEVDVYLLILIFCLLTCSRGAMQSITIVRPYPAMFASGVGFVKVFLLKIYPQYGYQSVILQWHLMLSFYSRIHALKITVFHNLLGWYCKCKCYDTVNYCKKRKANRNL